MRNRFQPILSILFIGAIVLNFYSIQAQTTWYNYQTTNQVRIDYSDPVNCNFSEGEVQMEYIFLKFSNLTNIAVNISYRVEYYYVGTGCATCTNNEYIYTINVPANGSITTNCDFKSAGQNKLAIFKKYINRTNKVQFDKFEISNITIQ